MDKVADFAAKEFNDAVEKLKKLVRIPSVSFDGFPPEEVNRSADAVAGLLKEEGLEHVEILRVGKAHPYVYADWLHAPGKPTLLLYAHHDVQPPGRPEVWKTSPFEPTQVGERLFGRGAADDKAGIIVHTSAIRAYLKVLGKLPLNVKLLIEGEEEIGSEHLEAFLEKYKDKMKADCLVLTDTSNYDVGVPTLTTSLRGLVSLEVTVKVMNQPLHSGMWGGPGPDPVLALSKMLASLTDNEGRIAIPGIYDKVLPMTPVESKSLASLNYTNDDYRKQTGLFPEAHIVGGPASPQEKITRLPSISVNAIQASSKKDVANIVTSEAWCKVGIRTVPSMDADDVAMKLQAHLAKHAPWGVKVIFDKIQKAPWWTTVPEGRAFEAASKALEKAFGRPCVFMGLGGSIPFVDPFARVLGGVPALLMGVEDPYTNAHSENESVHLGDLKKAILGAVHFYSAFAE